MDLNEFERQVLAGEITDFEPYFKEQYDSRKQINTTKWTSVTFSPKMASRRIASP